MFMRSIRARLTLWYTVILTVTLLFLGGSAYGLLSYSLSREVDAALNSVARTLTDRAHHANATFFPAEIDEIFRNFFGFSPWDRYFQMFDPMGRRDPRQHPATSSKLPLGREAVENAARGIATFETVHGLGEYPVRVLNMPVMDGGRMVNLIQVGMSLQSVTETRMRFLFIMAGLFPVALVLAGSGGWLLARRALKPVDLMAESARRISAEHLTQRIEESGAGDELDRLARTLNQMLGRLDASFSQVRRFSADASHELQTPLTILRGELEVALRSPRTSGEYESTIQSALEEVDRITRLVDGLLILHRAEAGALRMDRRTVDLGRLLEEVYWRLKVVSDSRSIHLDLISTEGVIIQGDREQLRRLILNLADNAVKYTEPGGRVILSLGLDGQWAVLDVADSGMGIPAGELDQIFQPFYRSEEVRSVAATGAGLGLSIARSIALAHGGRIEVESEPGHGSVFRLFIPLVS